MGFYADKILPHVLGAVMRLGNNDPVLVKQVTEVFDGAEGDVLEVGMGQGRTLPLYDKAKVRSVVGLEPSEGMRKHAITAAADSPIDVEVLDGDAQNMEFEPGTFDTVLSTFTMCSIPDHKAALAECRRVLKPGGKLVFIEHGRATGWRYPVQRVDEVLLHQRLFRCSLLRQPAQAMEEAGFNVKLSQQGVLKARWYPSWWVNTWTGYAEPR